MSRKFTFSHGEYYHLYNRGTEKRIIFLDDHDYKRFVLLLHLCNSKHPVDISNQLREGLTFTELMSIELNDRLVNIGVYCLMPNHFHLLINEKEEKGISLFMQKIMTAYTMYFNKKYRRTGSLFAGSFLARHANTDKYLKYLFSYIHLNPVKIIDPAWKENGIANRKNAKKYLGTYSYSSYLDYMEVERIQGKILNKQAFPEYFLSFCEFEQFIDEWLSFENI
jgi:putative transposase